MNVIRARWLIFIFFAAAYHSHAQGSFGAAEKFAWSGNLGWIAFRHDSPSPGDGVAVGETFLSGFAYSPNVGWIRFGSTPANGHTYTNAGSDHGVNHDGRGNLDGYAWGANIGWIDFGWARPTDNNRPRFSLQTGEMIGYAYSANTGWINLATNLLSVSSIVRPDTDNDGISDAWEYHKFGNLTTASGSTDADKDGASDLSEYRADTSPTDPEDNLRIVALTLLEPTSEIRIEFTSRPSRLYRLERSTNLLQPWKDSPLGTFRPSSGATTLRTFVIPDEPRLFFRAVSILPLNP